MFLRYFRLTKPGIVRGNLITASAGYFLAVGAAFDWPHDFWLYLATTAGLGLILASGCVANNWLDRDIDSRMERTKARALVTGEIPARNALIFASALLALGLVTLWLWTSSLATLVALFGWLFYVLIYTWWKRKSPTSTLIGSIAGAVSPVVGYTAVTGRLDTASLILFSILVFWQMPHFYAIGIFRAKDYKKAGLPILPLKRDARLLKASILCYIVAFTIVSGLLAEFIYASLAYLLFISILGLVWIWQGLQGFRKKSNDVLWARQIFSFSLIVLMGWSGAVIVDSLLASAVY